MMKWKNDDKKPKKLEQNFYVSMMNFFIVIVAMSCQSNLPAKLE